MKSSKQDKWNNTQKIIIDTREPASLRAKVSDIFRKEGFVCEEECLAYADYLYDGIGIERKEDFYNSIRTGRLWEQAKGLADYEKAFIIWVSRPYELAFVKNKKRAHLAILSALYTLPLSYNISVIKVGSDSEFIWVLKHIIMKSKRKGAKPQLLKKKGRKMREIREDILRCIDGVGDKTAKKLLDEYGTIGNIIREEDVAGRPLCILEVVDETLGLKILETLNGD